MIHTRPIILANSVAKRELIELASESLEMI